MTLSARIAAVATVVYVAVAVYMVMCDRAAPGAVRWNLNGIFSWIATFPVTVSCEEILGVSLDYKSNAHMGIAISLCAALVYFVTNKLSSLVQRLFA